jgi:hypothetical protein
VLILGTTCLVDLVEVMGDLYLKKHWSKLYFRDHVVVLNNNQHDNGIDEAREAERERNCKYI